MSTSNVVDLIQCQSEEDSSLKGLLERLHDLREAIQQTAGKYRQILDRVDVNHRLGAENLVHYLALRGMDLRTLQLELVRYGLSSLGRSEAHVLQNLNQVIERIEDTFLARHGVRAGRAWDHLSENVSSSRGGSPVSWTEADRLLRKHTRELLGPAPHGRHVYIMVTAPAADQVTPEWVAAMVKAGMNCLRINCAHESRDEWLRTIQTVRAFEAGSGAPCRIMMDLPGPKLRVGALSKAPEVQVWKPKRDVYGRMRQPARISLIAASRLQGNPPCPSVIAVPDQWWRRLLPGDEIRLRDTRDKERSLTIKEVAGGVAIVEASKTVYIGSGTRLRHLRSGGSSSAVCEASVARLKAFAEVRQGERLMLGGPEVQGFPEIRDESGTLIEPAILPCSSAEAIAALKPDDRVLFDDGKVSCVVRGVNGGFVQLQAIRIAKGHAKIREGHGINFPESRMDIPCMTSEDLETVSFIVEHADLIALSFVRDATDVAMLMAELHRRPSARPGLVLKIETQQGVRNLPAILLEAMQAYPLGVMIARGDLAVEAGFERLAELQEEILCLCEAAHLPVIWATQVLESLASTGLPSRAEITDAAMSVRAECVMLNKGPYIEQAARVLDDILIRMENHQYKRRNLYRMLEIARQSTSSSGIPLKLHAVCAQEETSGT